ncbi:hypothetical protein HEK616_26840 [Streptomyces nigrescens]|uniref:Integral membrane protein n=2 Tax=Streptomyces TaxID=1883 RepID=A0ABN6QSN5_STRNI|nr:hypothetical protein [Streptomyces nigrescens]MEE4418446.1 hypothetical protein [Streptomyces sp. DSM 41528]BDM69197.1 hypothetical protein HEK616_26840 [Streptomyces nigrescens]
MRLLLGIAGAVIVLGVFSSVLHSLVIPRPTPSGLGRIVQRLVHRPFRLLADRLPSAEAKDRVLAPMAPLAIVVTLIAWLGCFLVGYALLEAAVSRLGVKEALTESGSSLFTLGFASGDRATLNAIDFCAAVTGPIVIGLQVGYLPALYGAYQRRETEVTLLQARAGSPPWGPEILARYAQVELLEILTELFRTWERWSADVSESHTTYPILIHFRSPKATRNWLIALLSVMDAAALRLSFNPSQPQAEVRMALRAGFVCLREIATIEGIAYDRDPHPDDALQLSYEDFLRGVERMAAQGYPMERTPEEAWPHFRGWRVNYEALAYRLARDIEAVPAPWSGARRREVTIRTPLTPVDRRPVTSE